MRNPEGKWTREKVKRYLVQRLYTRFHMSLILSSSGLAAMLTSWALLHQGVHAMWVRSTCLRAARMKSYLDYGMFTPIQIAAITALEGPQECVAEISPLSPTGF